MSPERAVAQVERWVRAYTAGLPADVAERRREELRADLHDQVAHERALGHDEARIARAVRRRALRGAAADLSWSTHRRRAARAERRHESRPATARSALAVVAFVVAVLAIPLVGTLVSDGVGWSVGDFTLAGTLLVVIGTGADAARRRRGGLALAVAIAALGSLAAVAGERGDAPGLVVLGLVMIASGVGVARRRARPAR